MVLTRRARTGSDAADTDASGPLGDRLDKLKRQPEKTGQRISLFGKTDNKRAAPTKDAPDPALLAKPDFTRRPKTGNSRLRKIILPNED